MGLLNPSTHVGGIAESLAPNVPIPLRHPNCSGSTPPHNARHDREGSPAFQHACAARIAEIMEPPALQRVGLLPVLFAVQSRAGSFLGLSPKLPSSLQCSALGRWPKRRGQR